MPRAVRASVPITMGMIPSHSARTPQANFPTAPPTKRSVRANPTCPKGISLARRRKGRKVNRALRTEISRIPIASKNLKPLWLRIPQRPFCSPSIFTGCGADKALLALLVIHQRKPPTATPPGKRKNRVSPTPYVDHHREDEGQADLPQVTRKIVGPHGCATPGKLVDP